MVPEKKIPLPASIRLPLMRARVSRPKGHILVNCASLGPPGKAIGRDGRALPLRDFARTINSNLIGSFNTLSKFAASLHTAEALGEERRVIINSQRCRIRWPDWAGRLCSIQGRNCRTDATACP